jgi:hypothetical protein
VRRTETGVKEEGNLLKCFRVEILRQQLRQAAESFARCGWRSARSGASDRTENLAITKSDG